ncbi:MAG TPA: BadF/BadG/BcrA/BcrD ATPase family protein [Bacteroidota bacterium]|nr:BadF/BadG/BcrA/BcrD ATPase family protein [Bacteroidota bacterium]
MNYVLAVEGGGTKTNSVIADENGKIINSSTTGPSNFLIVGFEKACENIIQGVEECINNSKINKTDIRIAMLGLTGAGRKLDQDNMRKAFKGYSVLKGFSFSSIIVDSDARISLEAAFPNKPGMILISGTGSIMFGKDEKGNLYRVGGWGRILGDEGSGFYIGKKGLIASIKQIDGRGEKTLLFDLISEKFNLNSLETIIKSIYTDNFDIAKIAPLVFEAAEKDDKIAKEILDEAADELLLHIETMIRKINFNDRIGLSFVGSIITNDNYVRKKIVNYINSNLKQIELIDSNNEPIYGAVVMAINELKKIN